MPTGSLVPAWLLAVAAWCGAGRATREPAARACGGGPPPIARGAGAGAARWPRCWRRAGARGADRAPARARGRGRGAAAAVASGEAAAALEARPPLIELGLAREVARYTRSLAESSTDLVGDIHAWLLNLKAGVMASNGFHLHRFGEAAAALAGIIAVHLLVYHALAAVARALFARLAGLGRRRRLAQDRAAARRLERDRRHRDPARLGRRLCAGDPSVRRGRPHGPAADDVPQRLPAGRDRQGRAALGAGAALRRAAPPAARRIFSPTTGISGSAASPACWATACCSRCRSSRPTCRSGSARRSSTPSR